VNSASFLRLLALTAFAAGLMLAAARAQDVAAGTVSDLPKPAHVRIFPDLPYVPDAKPHQKLDLYLPSPVPGDPLPLIVYLHGGGWKKGGKADGRSFAFRMVARGYAVACVDYRLSSEELFPAQLEDCKAAVRWLRDNAERYRLDPDHFGAMGVSAGGYLASMLGVTRSTLLFDVGERLNQSSSVLAVCDFFGPTDLLQLHEYSAAAGTPQADEIVSLLGGDPHVQKLQTRKANPLTYLDGNAATFLLIQGTNDTVVPPAQSRLLYDALAKQHILVHLHLIHDAGHTGPAFVAPDINELVDKFFSRVLKPGSQPGDPQPAFITESTAAKN
jgi:acetyl esterase/lipase